MIFIVLGISVFSAVCGVLLITYLKFEVKKDYLYDETDTFDQRQLTDTFDQRQLKRWRL